MRQFGPRPTLGELQRTTPWVWLWCERCQHHAPLACAIAVILWGPDAPSDSCVPAHAVLVAAEKARPSSVQAGPAIISASIRFRPTPATKADAPMTVTPRMASITVVGTLAYLGLAVVGWGGPTAFFAHPALIALRS